MHTGKNLEQYINKNYKSKSEFARAIGASPQLVSAYVRSENLRHSTIGKIALAIGVDYATFLATLNNLDVVPVEVAHE